jgi:hypothetical protein
MFRKFFLIIVFFWQSIDAVDTKEFNETDKSIIIFFGLIFLIKGFSCLNCVNNFYLKIKKNSLYKKLYHVDNYTCFNAITFIFIINILLYISGFFTPKTFILFASILFIKMLNLIPLDKLDTIQSSIENNQYKIILLIDFLKFCLFLGVRYFAWILLLGHCISVSQYRNFIYLFIIYILIEKAIYCASIKQSKGQIDFEYFIRDHQGIKFSFSFNKNRLLEKIKTTYGDDLFNHVNNYFTILEELTVTLRDYLDRVRWQYIPYDFRSFLEVCGNNTVQDKLSINFNVLTDEMAIQCRDYFVAKMQLAGILFALLGPQYVLYSVVCHDVVMRNHAYCTGDDIKKNGHTKCKNGKFGCIMKDFINNNYDYPVDVIEKLIKINLENDFSAEKDGFIDFNKIKGQKGEKINNFITKLKPGEEINPPEGIISCKIEQIINKPKMHFKKFYLKTLSLLRFLA